MFRRRGVVIIPNDAMTLVIGKLLNFKENCMLTLVIDIWKDS